MSKVMILREPVTQTPYRGMNKIGNVVMFLIRGSCSMKLKVNPVPTATIKSNNPKMWNSKYLRSPLLSIRIIGTSSPTAKSP